MPTSPALSPKQSPRPEARRWSFPLPASIVEPVATTKPTDMQIWTESRGTLQRIGVRLVSVDDEEKWVEVRTPVCEDHELDPREDLFRNCRLVVGHLELRPDNRK